MKVTVMRLKNAPKGEPYAIDRVDDLTPDQAGQVSLQWWESRGTLSLLLLVDGKEDSRYDRKYLDTGRVPEQWPKPKPGHATPPPVPPSPMPQQAPVRPAAPPTLANPRRPSRKAVKCPTCERPMADPARREEASDSTRCPTCGQAFTCGTCLAVLPASRRYDGDEDPTPSGRLANHRCPECGAPQRGMSGRDIWNMYTKRRR